MSLHKANELLAKRKKLFKEAKAIFAKAEKANREMDEVEQLQFDALMDKCDRMTAEAERLESDLSHRERAAAVNGGYDPSNGFPEPHVTSDGRRIFAYRRGQSIFEHRAALEGWTDDMKAATPGKVMRAYALGREHEVRGISSTGGISGNIMLPVQARILDDLKDQSWLGRAGALFLNEPGPSLAVTRITTPADFRFYAENAASTDSDPLFGAVTIQNEVARLIYKASREVIADAVGAEEALNREIAGQQRETVERYSLRGLSTAGEPQGLLNDSDVNAVNFGGSTSGAAPTSTGAGGYLDLMLAKQRLLEDKIPEERISMLWHPRVQRQFGYLRDANNQWLPAPPDLMDVPKYVTTAVPSTYDPGAGGSPIVLGDFGDFYVNQSMSGVELLRERFADNFQYGWLSYLRVGVSAVRPAAFEIINRVTT
ncbi:MAG TPA: phage major capsid protein [Polyangiaceae bacterium LLY-WYZ-14_1]|nr:phage major capsid protein [Polyangiaceae bacterium LLY-WYZ-14_1]